MAQQNNTMTLALQRASLKVSVAMTLGRSFLRYIPTSFQSQVELTRLSTPVIHPLFNIGHCRIDWFYLKQIP